MHQSSRLFCQLVAGSICPPCIPLTSEMPQPAHFAASLPFTGKVFVHCAMGVSRSATLVLAFLMIHENMTLVDALKTVGSHRDICPNTGFLSQLRELDIKLSEERKGTREPASKAL